jgi:hypothetical protein
VFQLLGFTAGHMGAVSEMNSAFSRVYHEQVFGPDEARDDKHH